MCKKLPLDGLCLLVCAITKPVRVSLCLLYRILVNRKASVYAEQNTHGSVSLPVSGFELLLEYGKRPQSRWQSDWQCGLKNLIIGDLTDIQDQGVHGKPY